MRRFVIILLSMSLLLLLLVPATAVAKPSFDKAIDKLIKHGYPQKIEDYLTSLGTNPEYGFRFGGSRSDDQAAFYLARQFKKLGFRNVRLEPVPLDEWNFKHASVTVGDVELPASTFGGVPPTPCGGITREVVYVGDGTAAAFGTTDVADKIVLIDAFLGSWWMNWPLCEASLRDAAAIVYCSTADDLSYYAEPEAIGSFDAEYQYDFAPAVHVSRVSGDWLKEQLDEGPVTAKVVNDVRVRLAEDGGKGYNVYAELPGRCRSDGMVLFMAHHDCYFRAGLDDTGGTACALTMAKAMRDSDWRPKRTMAFLITTGEEYGRIDSYYDWLIGAWWAITQEHPEWAGKITGVLNYESMAMNGSSLQMRVNPELRDLVTGIADANPDKVKWGYAVADVFCWNDQWPFTAAGVPSVYFRARTPDYGSKWYHTQFDTTALQDYEYMGNIAKLSKQIADTFDSGLLPYDLAERGADLAAFVDATELTDAGADPDVVSRLIDELTAFRQAADAFEADKGDIRWWRIPRVNHKLVDIEVDINSSFTALDAWDNTVYPHVQVLADAKQLNDAIAALKMTPPGTAAALAALEDVGINTNGLSFSYENWQINRAMHDPDYPGLYWGAQGHLAPYLDIIPEYRQIEAGNVAAVAAALVSLQAMRDAQVEELDVRLAEIADVLEVATPKIERLTHGHWH